MEKSAQEPREIDSQTRDNGVLSEKAGVMEKMVSILHSLLRCNCPH